MRTDVIFFSSMTRRGAGGEFGFRKRDGIFGHAIERDEFEHGMFAGLHHAAQVAVGDDAKQFTGGVGDGGEAEAFAGHFRKSRRAFWYRARRAEADRRRA